MIYSAILVDVFNLIHKKKGQGPDAKSVANAVIDYVETTLKAKLDSDSAKLYLLFDPMPVSDLGISGQFRTFTTTRKAIKSSYKGSREKEPLVLETADYIRKYFSYRDPAYVVVISEKHEADDFVESIVATSGKTLLVSTDYDWARYLSKDVEMSLGNVNEPFTVNDFRAKFGYLPSIKNVTVSKALFGDPSDEIDGIFEKKFPYKELGVQALQFISNVEETLDDFIGRTRSYTFKGLFETKDRNPEQDLFYQMHCFEKKNLVSQFFLNVSLVRSQCADAKKFMHEFPKRDSGFCATVDKALERGQHKSAFRFGTIKL